MDCEWVIVCVYAVSWMYAARFDECCSTYVYCVWGVLRAVFYFYFQGSRVTESNFIITTRAGSTSSAQCRWSSRVELTSLSWSSISASLKFSGRFERPTNRLLKLLFFFLHSTWTVQFGAWSVSQSVKRCVSAWFMSFNTAAAAAVQKSRTCYPTSPTPPAQQQHYKEAVLISMWCDGRTTQFHFFPLVRQCKFYVIVALDDRGLESQLNPILSSISIIGLKFRWEQQQHFLLDAEVKVSNG